MLIVVADHRSRILYAHFGSYGHESDAGIFDRSDFKRLINDAGNPLNLTADLPLPGTDRPMPFFFIGDGAFPLTTHIMKPFGQRNLTDEKRIFNYRQGQGFGTHGFTNVPYFRLSRARRVVESTFGIMASKWRVLLKPIETTVQKADVVVKAVCCLHNYLIAEGEAGQVISVEELELGEQLRQATMRNPMANHPANDATVNREHLVNFFNGVGAVEWQDEMI